MRTITGIICREVFYQPVPNRWEMTLGICQEQWLITLDLKRERTAFTGLFFIVRAVTPPLKTLTCGGTFQAASGNRLMHGSSVAMALKITPPQYKHPRAGSPSCPNLTVALTLCQPPNWLPIPWFQRELATRRRMHGALPPLLRRVESFQATIATTVSRTAVQAVETFCVWTVTLSGGTFGI